MKNLNLNQTYRYNGSPVTFRKGDSVMVNATEMAKPFGKTTKDWMRTNQAKEFMSTLSAVRQICLSDLVKVVKGGNGEQGTWMHEDVALEFARWLAPAFAIWCNDRIKELLNKAAVSDTPEEKKRLTKTRIRAALTWVKGVSEVMNLSPSARLELLRQVADGAATPLPAYVPSDHILRSATDLLRDNGAKINTIEFNRLLLKHGYLEVLTRRASHGAVKSFKHITDKGLEFGENRINPKYPTATQPLWYVDRFPELLDAVNAAADETPALQLLTAADNNCTAAPEVHNHNTIMNRPTICFVD